MYTPRAPTPIALGPYCPPGTLDDFRMHDRVLTAAEVLSLYQDPSSPGETTIPRAAYISTTLWLIGPAKGVVV